MKTIIYALEDHNTDFVQREVDIDEPDAEEVLVEIVASGICHSDLNIVNGPSPGPSLLPIVLGHEGTGIVRKVGSSVGQLQPGDSVVLCWTHCSACDRCESGEKPLCDQWVSWNLLGNRYNGTKTWSDSNAQYSNFLSQGSFARHVLVHQSGAIKVDAKADLEVLAAGVGCGVLTGAGTVFNAFKDARVGSTIVVFGIGAVGAGAIMAARTSPYSKIIAVDLHASRLETAKQIGATHVINGRDPDVASQIMELGGADYAVEATGVPAVLGTAYQSLRKGGTVAVVGIAPFDKTFQLPISMHMSLGKKIIGVPLGAANPKMFIPFLIQLYEQGRLPVDKLVKRFPITQLQDALKAMKDGSAIKPVLVL